MTCDELRDLAPELAMGTLSGELRASALAHLEHCAACQSEVDELTAVVDELVAMAPRVEPPAGFEERVLAALPAAAPGGGRNGAVVAIGRRVARGPWVAVAAGLVLLAGGVGGWAVSQATQGGSATVAVGPDHEAPGPLEEATFFAAGSPVGHMYAYWGSSAWVYMSVARPSWAGRYSCELVRNDGAVVRLGSFEVTNGVGWWAVPVHVTGSDVRQARLLDANGQVVATAQL
ncbi:MAG TPA: zf-HC2 domain-containing protein [Acidimicrobiales bacterium]|nr:zf-HC2 domain-containing protein [Acidimicrobiales bacterium]